jgi:hypothetical protein
MLVAVVLWCSRVVLWWMGSFFFWISELQIGTNQGDGIRMFFSGDS